MISFDKLWITLKERNISQYKLIKEYKISTGQLDRLRKNGNVNTYTLNELCKILDCRLEDIAEYKKDSQCKKYTGLRNFKRYIKKEPSVQNEFKVLLLFNALNMQI